jgi:hypothetical protein
MIEFQSVVDAMQLRHRGGDWGWSSGTPACRPKRLIEFRIGIHLDDRTAIFWTMPPISRRDWRGSPSRRNLSFRERVAAGARQGEGGIR